MKKHLTLLLVVLFAISFQAYSQVNLDSVDSLIDTVKGRPLSSIGRNYTLSLTGYFDDCGEFGGHLETIEIKRIENQLTAILTIYKKDCSNSDKKESKIKKSKQYPLNEDHIKLIESYLSELLTKTIGYNVIGHAGRVYTARMEFIKDDLLGNDPYTRLLLEYHDSYNTWGKFEELKDKIAK